MATPFQLVIDCSDPDSLAGFWAEAIGYVKQPPPPGYDSWEALLAEMGIPEDRWNSRSAIVPPDDDTGTRIFFQQVPEPKAAKNRLHLDISVGAGSPPQERPAIVDAEVERANEDPDLLHAVLEGQNYRLAYWRVAARDLGYRRFFDVNSLVALRAEDDRVFAETHVLVLDWLRQPDVTGVLVVDSDADRLRQLERRLQDGRLQTLAADVGDESRLVDALRESAALVSAVPYFLNIAMTKIAIAARVPIVDMGGNTDVVFQQSALDEEAKAAGIAIRNSGSSLSAAASRAPPRAWGSERAPSTRCMMYWLAPQ